MLKAIIASLSLVLLANRVEAANNYEEASKKAIKALAIQTGVADVLDARVREFTEKYAPNLVKENGAVLVFFIRGITENYWQLGHKWEF